MSANDVASMLVERCVIAMREMAFTNKHIDIWISLQISSLDDLNVRRSHII